MIQVIPQWCGNAVAGGTVSLHRVGKKVEQGYHLTDGLANWFVEKGELDSKGWAQWLRQSSDGEKTVHQIADETGVTFSDLEEGVYLVAQTEAAPGYTPFEPFLLAIPDGNAWDIIARPKLIALGESPRTGDHPAPIIGAMGVGLSVAVLMVLVDEHKK